LKYLEPADPLTLIVWNTQNWQFLWKIKEPPHHTGCYLPGGL
jgi:hypothetical protein